MSVVSVLLRLRLELVLVRRDRCRAPHALELAFHVVADVFFVGAVLWYTRDAAAAASWGTDILVIQSSAGGGVACDGVEVTPVAD